VKHSPLISRWFVWISALAVAGFLFSPLPTHAASSWLNSLLGALGRLNGGGTGGSATITGRLTYTDGTAASGQRVGASGATTVLSDSNGNYRISPITIGSGGTVTVTVTFYCTSPVGTQPVSLSANQTRDLGIHSCGTKPNNGGGNPNPPAPTPPPTQNIATVKGILRTTAGGIPSNTTVTVDGKAVSGAAGSYTSTVNLGNSTSKYINIVFGCAPNPAYWRTVTKGTTTTVDYTNCPVSSSTQTGSVTGTVKDKNGALEKNVSVTVDGKTALTHASTGIFTVTGISNVPRTVTASYPCTGGTPQSTNVSVPAGTATVAWQCPASSGGGGGGTPPVLTATITGTVSSGTTPIKGVAVMLAGLTSGPVTTDDNGRYTITNITGVPRTIELGFNWKEQGKSDKKRVYITAGSNVVDYTFADDALTAEIYGTVTRGESSYPVPGASVMVYQPNKQQPVLQKTAVTNQTGDDIGDYTVSGALAKQNALVQAEDSLGNRVSREVQINPGKNLVDLAMRFDSYGNTLTVRVNIPQTEPADTIRPLVAKVFDSQNQLVEVISLYYRDRNPRIYGGAGSPRVLYSGNYRVELWSGVSDRARQLAGSQSVTFVADNSEDKLVTFSLDSVPVQQAIFDVYVKSINATDSNGFVPITNANVEIKRTSKSIATAVTDSNGKAIFNLNVEDTLAFLSDGLIDVSATGYESRVVQNWKMRGDDWTGNTLVILLTPTGAKIEACDNHPTTALAEFWICGDEAKQMYLANTAYVSLIDSTVTALQNRYPQFKQTPPELVITSDREDGALFQPFKKDASLGCWPSSNAAVPKDDSYIEIKTGLLKNASESIVRMVVSHEWRHAADFKNGSCQSFLTDGSSRWREYVDQLRLMPTGFRALTENTYQARSGGHPYDDGELVASSFVIGLYYRNEFTTFINGLTADQQGLMQEIVNGALAP